LLNSLIFSRALVASLGVGPPCFSLPFHKSGELLVFGDKLDAAATAAAKYGRCEAPIGDGHWGNTCCGLKSVLGLRFGGCEAESSEVRFRLLTLKSRGPFPGSPAGGVLGLLKFTTSESLSASLFWPRLLKSKIPSPGGECIGASTWWRAPGGEDEDDTRGDTAALLYPDGEVIMSRWDCWAAAATAAALRYAAMAAVWGGSNAAAAAAGRVAGRVTPTGLRAEAAMGTPRKRAARSDNIDSPDGQRGCTSESDDSRELHRELAKSLQTKRSVNTARTPERDWLRERKRITIKPRLH
jgi:hypothetical protein